MQAFMPEIMAVNLGVNNPAPVKFNTAAGTAVKQPGNFLKVLISQANGAADSTDANTQSANLPNSSETDLAALTQLLAGAVIPPVISPIPTAPDTDINQVNAGSYPLEIELPTTMAEGWAWQAEPPNWPRADEGSSNNKTLLEPALLMADIQVVAADDNGESVAVTLNQTPSVPVIAVNSLASELQVTAEDTILAASTKERQSTENNPETDPLVVVKDQLPADQMTGQAKIAIKPDQVDNAPDILVAQVVISPTPVNENHNGVIPVTAEQLAANDVVSPGQEGVIPSVTQTTVVAAGVAVQIADQTKRQPTAPDAAELTVVNDETGPSENLIKPAAIIPVSQAVAPIKDEAATNAAPTEPQPVMSLDDTLGEKPVTGDSSSDKQPQEFKMNSDGAMLLKLQQAIHNRIPNQEPEAYNQESIKQVIQRLELMVKENASQAKLVLKPEHLGNLIIRMDVQDGVLTAKFVVENQQARAMLETNMTVFRQQLEQNGIRVDKVEVTLNQTGNDASQFLNQGQYRQPGQGGYQNQNSYWQSGRDNYTLEGYLSPVPEAEMVSSRPIGAGSSEGLNYVI